METTTTTPECVKPEHTTLLDAIAELAAAVMVSAKHQGEKKSAVKAEAAAWRKLARVMGYDDKKATEEVAQWMAERY